MAITPNSVTLSIFRHLFASVADEMGVTLERAAYSPNIKERLDFSCALFLGDGRLLAQAAHIPVHLGAMPASVRVAIGRCAPFVPGDVVIVNDPYLGGNHLPDITLVSPVFFADDNGEEKKFAADSPSPPGSPAFFVASRAHHADIGGMSPGSMPLSTEIYQEGIIIPPIKLVAAGKRNDAVWQLILRNVRTPAEREGDLAAQLAAHTIGEKRLVEIVARYGLAETMGYADELIAYADRLTRAAISQMPHGRFSFTDYLDNDGQSATPIPISVTVTIENGELAADFSGTAPAVQGNLNAVPAIVESAVAYCVRCTALALLQSDLPMNQGAFAPISVLIPPGSLIDPHPPHAVAAGNVETSQRIVDVVFGALAQALPDLIPAASQGTMNNLTFGGVLVKEGKPHPFAYYETIGGGAGAGPTSSSASGIHVHMSNTLNTPIEALEHSYPLRVVSYTLRHGSGGNGRFRGGDGLVRSIQFLVPATATITSERRVLPPYGLRGGEPGQTGANSLRRQGEEEERMLPGKTVVALRTGDILTIATPGGGGWGPKKELENRKPTSQQTLLTLFLLLSIFFFIITGCQSETAVSMTVPGDTATTQYPSPQSPVSSLQSLASSPQSPLSSPQRQVSSLQNPTFPAPATSTPPPTTTPKPTSTATPTATPIPSCTQRVADDSLFTLVTLVYGLSRDYAPSDLVDLNDYLSHRVTQGFPLQLRQVAVEPLVSLITAMEAAGLRPQVLSAYRSYSAQYLAWRKWQDSHPESAAIVSAPPGHSEHQLGTTVDFGSPELKDIVGEEDVEFHTYFFRTREGEWLLANAHQYGFTLSYPREAFEITGFYYEPWHYRYVGIEMATQLREMGLSFTEFMLAQNAQPCVP